MPITESLTQSSERLVQFLEDTNLHKKDFAEMIGVTLSYVYSLIGAEVSFSTRTTTLERIAVVMGVSPDCFPEYRHTDEPRLVDAGVTFLKHKQQEAGLTNVQLLKRFPRQQRVEIVDMWRGALPLPLDWHQLMMISDVLGVAKDDIYPYWETRLQQYLISGGIDPLSNAGVIQSMFKGLKQYIGV